MTSFKVELKQVSALRILLTCVILIPLLSIISISIIYNHLSSIDQNIFIICANESTYEFQSCANKVLYNYFADSQWISKQFILYQSVALFITLFACYNKVSSPFIQSTIIGLISSGALGYIFTPGRLIAVSALVGCLFGGLIAKYLIDKK